MAAAEAATTGTPERGAYNETRGTVLAQDVERARSFVARFMGLMGRPNLPLGNALWLEGNGIHMLFMRFPIDAVFVARPASDGTRRVVSTHRGVRPWVGLVPFVRGAHGVLELPVGAIDASATAPGDSIRLS
jgi:uncharacterized membrane protein (UPF0127 family)